MTLPEDVQDAMDSADNDCGLDLTYMTRDEWHDIRAHLLSQDAEIARLQSGLAKHVNRMCKLQSRLDAADALLKDLYARFDRINHDEDGDAYINESHYGMRNIEAYRKGAGDEA